ncbi:MAG: DUF4390 domain-containing protein [Gammaproteobacteria bacterium]|nr:DUF4390 domain-containing protein [Gammaproteobacteria bacterium]
MANPPGPAAGISISQAKIEREGEFYLLQAVIQYNPSAAVLEALHSGVPMVFQVQLQVQRRGAWFWEYPILERRLPYQLRYHALAAAYELITPEGAQPLRFATLAAALRVMGKLERSRLVPVDYLKPNTPYELRMEVTLDIESLPVPLRPLAYLSKNWSIHQETRRWPLNP